MDCNKVLIRLAEIRQASKQAADAIGNGNSIQCERMLDVIEILVKAIRSEVRS